ncbi:MAG: hypothetical protein HY436_01590, partial [Candidatus Liptonbacteria bacterium]|nr:hypothetical protein [Candidatus Liptonbacteria bacterium]
MRLSSRTKILLLFFGDIAALYAALVAALLIRYGAAAFAEQFVRFHVLPFTLIFPVWLLVFFVAGLYDLPRLRNNIDFAKTLFLTLGVNALLTIAIFYFIPYFTIAPKTNLFLFIAVLALIEIWWRRTFNVRAAFREGLNRVLLLGESPAAAEIIRALKANPQIGYEIAVWLKRGLTDPEMQAPHAIVRRHGVNLVVIPQEVKHNPHLTRIFYELLASGVEVRDLPGFYELVFQKVPTKSIKEVWFLEHRLGERRF